MPPTTTKTIRAEFTQDHDSYLCKYIARHCPGKEGRSGQKLYQQLVADPVQWPWAKHHPWQSWRERYVKHTDHFDACILRYQKKHGIRPVEKRKRVSEPSPNEASRQSAKRVKHVQKEEEEEGETPKKSETHRETQSEDAGSSTSVVEQPPPSKATSSRPNSVRKPAHPITPNGTPSHVNADAKSATKQDTLNPFSQTQTDTVENPSTSPNRQASPPESSTPRHVKRSKVRLGSPSDPFTSDHEMDAAINGAPSSPTRPPPPTTTPPRAPPRVVDAIHGQVMVDREGRVPCALQREERNGNEQEEKEAEDKAQWPPVRIKPKSTNEPTVEGDPHHAFSQLPTTIRSGTSPVKRIVTTAPASDPFSGQILKPFSKAFSAPRASTRSPFRAERPGGVPQRSPSQGKAARHPALTRIRRQSMNTQDSRRERNKRGVPSVDLVLLSRSSTSAHSHSSTDTSVVARPQRWSLPAMPWVFDEPGNRTVASSLWPHGTSTPRLMLTPSPARPNGAVSAPQTNGTSSALLAPHPPDVPLTSSHGLASILGHMSANHGLALSVVEAVYKRVGNLREADEVLKVMREAADGIGEQEIKRRVRGSRKSHEHRQRGREVRRVVAMSSEEDESEYSPPETSRAAMWKRQSESASFDEEEEEAEGREVEEELRDRGEEEETHHEFSQMEGQARDEQEVIQWEVPGNVIEVVQNIQHAHELEKKLGKEHFRRDIAALWRSGKTH